MFPVTGGVWQRAGRFIFINRWECGKSKPNMSAMKKIKDFCELHSLDFTTLEEQWTEIGEDK